MSLVKYAGTINNEPVFRYYHSDSQAVKMFGIIARHRSGKLTDIMKWIEDKWSRISLKSKSKENCNYCENANHDCTHINQPCNCKECCL